MKVGDLVRLTEKSALGRTLITRKNYGMIMEIFYKTSHKLQELGLAEHGELQVRVRWLDVEGGKTYTENGHVDAHHSTNELEIISE